MKIPKYKLFCLLVVLSTKRCFTETSEVFSCDFGRDKTNGGAGLHVCGITSPHWVLQNGRGRFGLARSTDKMDGYYVLQRINGKGEGRFTLPNLQAKKTTLHLSFFYKFFGPRQCGFHVTAGGKVVFDLINPEAGWLEARDIPIICGNSPDGNCPRVSFIGTCSRTTGVLAVDDIVADVYNEETTILDQTTDMTTHSQPTSSNEYIHFEELTSLEDRSTAEVSVTGGQHNSTKATTISPAPSDIKVDGGSLAMYIPLAGVVVLAVLAPVIIGVIISRSKRTIPRQKNSSYVSSATRGNGGSSGIQKVIEEEYIDIFQVDQFGNSKQQSDHLYQDLEGHYIPMMPRTDAPEIKPDDVRRATIGLVHDGTGTKIQWEDDYMEPDQHSYINATWGRSSYEEIAQTTAGQVDAETKEGSTHNPTYPNDLVNENSWISNDLFVNSDDQNEFYEHPNPTYTPFEEP